MISVMSMVHQDLLRIALTTWRWWKGQQCESTHMNCNIMTIKCHVTHCGTNDSCLSTILPPHSTQCLRCSGHHYRFNQCLSGSVNRFTINVLSINASVPTFESLFWTYNRSSNSSISVDGSSGPMEMVSVNIPAGVFRTVDLLRTFLSAVPISPHLCLSVTLQNTNALHTTATAFYTAIWPPCLAHHSWRMSSQSLHCRYCSANLTFQ